MRIYYFKIADHLSIQETDFIGTCLFAHVLQSCLLCFFRFCQKPLVCHMTPVSRSVLVKLLNVYGKDTEKTVYSVVIYNAKSPIGLLQDITIFVIFECRQMKILK